MNTSTLRLTGLSALSLAAGACTDGSVQNDPRPNIVLFLADDIGAECFGCMGGVSYDTHTIDSLARNGLFFPPVFLLLGGWLALRPARRSAAWDGAGLLLSRAVDDRSVQRPQLRLLRLYE